MAMWAYETKISWDHDMTTDTAFRSATDPILATLVTQGKTLSVESVDSVVDGGTWTYARLWVDEAAAQSWVNTVNTYAGYVSSTVTPVL